MCSSSHRSPLHCFAAVFLWMLAVQVAQADFLWGRTIKHCTIKLCLDVYGIGLKMAIEINVKIYISQTIELEKQGYSMWSAM